MARIRSVHPGFFTDEAVVSCSAEARLLLIGLWTEADDGGVFAWKTLTLKMRLFPADNVDANELLAELEGANIIRRFEAEGSVWGAIRNFMEFQRPKAPKITLPRLDWVPEYCGMKRSKGRNGSGSGDGGSEAHGDEAAGFPNFSEIARDEAASVPLVSEKSRQMEDGEGEERTESSLRSDSWPQAASARSRLAAEIWQQERGPMPSIKLPMAKAREQAILARIRERFRTPADWRDHVRHMAATPFLAGDNDRGWKADIDFAVSASKCSRIVEGHYDNLRRNGTGRGHGDAILEAHRRGMDFERDAEHAGQDGFEGEFGGLPALRH